MSTIGSASGRPPTSRPAVSRTRPSCTTQTSHDVPPMSKHRRSATPVRSASSAAAAAPPAGPLSTVSAACSAASAGVGQAAAGLHDRRRRERLVLGAGDQPAQVRGEQGGEGGVDLGRRRALELAERADHLVAERDVHARQRPAQRLAERLLVGGEAVGVQQADGDGLDVQAGDLGGRRPRGVVGERLEHALGAGALAGADAALGRHERLGMGRAQAVQVLARLPAELDDVGEAGGRDERGPRAAALEQRVGRHGHAVGERLDLARAAPAALSAAWIASRTPADWSVGVVGALAVTMRPPTTSTASVNVPPTSTPSSTARTLTGPCSPVRSR
jgi:hypothetical protein